MGESNTALLEALETLTSIADLDLESEDGIVEKDHLIVDGNKFHYRTFEWQGSGDEVEPDALLKKTFNTILKYLREYCDKEHHGFVTDQQSIEGIKSIMVLVGESARKLDKFTNLFHDTKVKRVTGLREYQKLQEFYLTRIARRVDTSTLGQWILGIAQGAFPAEAMKPPKSKIEMKHLFVDLESVKKDLDYELFFMRKEDGSHFFNPRLIKNMKLVCDFGDNLKQMKEAGEDHLAHLDLIHDRFVQKSAKSMIKSLEPELSWFYKEASSFKKRDFVTYINQALMALILSSNARHLLEKDPAKCCSEYFLDFQEFLIKALQSAEYQKLMAYPPNKKNNVLCRVIESIHAICYGLFMNMHGYAALQPELQNLLCEGKALFKTPLKEKVMSDKIFAGYHAIAELIKKHPFGPLTKVLDTMEDGEWHAFDPLHQENIPQFLFSFELQDAIISVLHLPTPTRQEYLDKATVNEEFKGFLLGMRERDKNNKFLLINLQDRTSWKERARCVALEELQNHPDFVNKLTVVTLSKDSDFYYQENSYSHNNQAKSFMKQFVQQLQEEDTGFYFPDEVKDLLFPDTAQEMMHHIHRIFFSEKNVLSKGQRQAFIEIFYTFLQLKLLEIIKPAAMSFTCKDAVDSGGAAGVQWLAFLTLLAKEEVEEGDLERMQLILHLPSLLVRCRVILPDRFESLMNTVKVIEAAREEYGFENFRTIVQEAFMSKGSQSLRPI